MLIALVADSIDTFYRTVSGFFGNGTTVPGFDLVFKPTTIDMIVFLILYLGIIYGIYLLYNLKKAGGYWFMISQILFLIYAIVWGPIGTVLSEIYLLIIGYMAVYVILSIFIPWLYSEKFE
ncbi:MAG: hypothetical protein CMI98_03835 [Pelagibacteraceae bacterium]|nr:hypothetical protein [Pelagibacteraceae bacterium]